MTTQQEISGKWNTIVGSVKEKYGQITDDDLRRVQGDLNQLAGLLAGLLLGVCVGVHRERELSRRTRWSR